MTQILKTNNLLTALPQKIRQQFIASCEYVDLLHDEVLCLPGKPLQYIYFPTSGYISLVRKIDIKSSIEVALVGNEGMLDVGPALGISESMLHVSVQGEGNAFRLKTAKFCRELQYNLILQRLIAHYIFVRMSQITQMTVCTRLHVIEARLARCLLLRHDRSPSDEIHITQQSLASVLGVRRVGITNAAMSLQNRQLIVYNRGILQIINRKGLEGASCVCYKVDKAIYDRTMS